MLWNGIKKAINRAGAQIMVKTGQIEETSDMGYDYEEKRYKTMKNKSKKLQREFKLYLESLKMLTRAQKNVLEVLAAFYGDGPHVSSLAIEYRKTMNEISTNALEEIQQPYFQTVINPNTRFQSYFLEIDKVIKKRLGKLVDYEALMAKVKKLSENPTEEKIYETKLNEAQSQLEESQKAYQVVNDQLKNEMPKFVNLRIPFLDPLFELFIKLQLRFFSQSRKEMERMNGALDMKTRQDYLSGELDKRIDEVLGKMKELNITGFT